MSHLVEFFIEVVELITEFVSPSTEPKNLVADLAQQENLKKLIERNPRFGDPISEGAYRAGSNGTESLEDVKE